MFKYFALVFVATHLTRLTTSQNYTGKHNVKKEEIAPRLYLPKISQCAENDNKFCTENEDYPSEYINQLLENRTDLVSKYFKVHGDLVQSGKNRRKRSTTSSNPAISMKQQKGIDIDSNGHHSEMDMNNLDYEEVELCTAERVQICPTSGESDDGKKILIVNTDKLKQCVFIETCSEQGQKCGDDAWLPNGYTSKCKQHYIYRVMLSLVDEKLVEQNIKIPSSCSCALYRKKSKK